MDNESILEIISKNIKSTEIDDKLKICDFRKLLYKELHRDFSYKYAELIRKLFAIEVKEREALCSYDSNVAREIDNTYDCPLSIICSTYLLYRLGDLNDVKSIWNAKCIDYDSYFEIDGQFLVGAGVDETIAFLRRKRGRIAKFIIKDIKRYKKQGAFEQSAYTNWKNRMNKMMDNL